MVPILWEAGSRNGRRDLHQVPEGREMTSSTGDAVVLIDYDFNSPSNEFGDYEVVLDWPMAGLIHPGSRVTIGSYADHVVRRGRVRCLIALVELTDDLMTGEPLP